MGFIILLGPKHTGKTTTAKALARLLALPFYDLDQLVEERTGLSPRQLYTAGPERFRREEAAALEALLGDFPPGAAAAGGGITDNGEALALLRRAEKAGAGHHLVCLELAASAAWERIAARGELPPFLQAEDPAASREKHRALHERRAEDCRSWTALRVSVEGKTPDGLAEEIRTILAKAP